MTKARGRPGVFKVHCGSQNFCDVLVHKFCRLTPSPTVHSTSFSLFPLGGISPCLLLPLFFVIVITSDLTVLDTSPPYFFNAIGFCVPNWWSVCSLNAITVLPSVLSSGASSGWLLGFFLDVGSDCNPQFSEGGCRFLLQFGQKYKSSCSLKLSFGTHLCSLVLPTASYSFFLAIKLRYFRLGLHQR